ncbi:MAG: hypothetical protein RL386_1479 [Bacteroidota bacterium]
MLLILAWRNIWRNPARSLVVLGAIGTGIWAALLMTGFATGMVRSYIDGSIANVVAHIQLHHPGYEKEKEVKFSIPAVPSMAEFLDKDPGVKAWSTRTLAGGMISSAKASRGVAIKGVIPDKEATASKLKENITEGAYFEPGRKFQILVGAKLAGKLKVGLRNKVVLTFQDMEGNITTGAFRISGLFTSNNSVFDETQVFVLQQDLAGILVGGMGIVPVPIHEIAVMCSDPANVVAVQQRILKRFPDISAKSYREIAPELELYERQIHFVSLVYLVIVMLALVFGIINTMLMSVLERYRELGMLMAIGMNKGHIFGMILLETLLLSLAGAPFGVGAGALSISYFSANPLDLSVFADSLNQYGMGTQIYFQIRPYVYTQTIALLILTAFISALYPALRAVRLKPVEAIRKI